MGEYEKPARDEILNGVALAVIVIGLLLLLVFLASCSSPASVVRIRLENNTAQPITIDASAGLFARTITIQPGQTWAGWVDSRFIASSIRIAAR